MNPEDKPLKFRKTLFYFPQIFNLFLKKIYLIFQVQGETGGQLRYSGVFGTVSGIARNEGPRWEEIIIFRSYLCLKRKLDKGSFLRRFLSCESQTGTKRCFSRSRRKEGRKEGRKSYFSRPGVLSATNSLWAVCLESKMSHWGNAGSQKNASLRWEN